MVVVFVRKQDGLEAIEAEAERSEAELDLAEGESGIYEDSVVVVAEEGGVAGASAAEEGDRELGVRKNMTIESII